MTSVALIGAGSVEATARWTARQLDAGPAITAQDRASASLDLETIRTVCDELPAVHADAVAPGLRA